MLHTAAARPPSLAARVLSLLWVVSVAVAAAEPLDVPRVEAGPAIDGDLSDTAWSEALVVDDFRARLPVEGAAPSTATEVRLLHSGRSLYIALRAFDPQPQSLRLASMRRDDFAITEGDQFVIAIDSFLDRRNGYWFSTNPLGVRVDAQFSDEGERFEDHWNGVWEAAARVDAQGWTAELEIPWSTLRFRAAPEVVMGINLFRRIPRTHEQIFAPPIPLVYPYGTPNVSIARAYRFRDIAGGARLDLRPFALASLDRRTHAARRERDGGLFLRLPLGDALTLAGTLRADFSEVEADETQLNLTRFPLFLPERRDFFLEGAGLFAFGVPGEAELFFSRRIGFVGGEGSTTVPVEWGGKASGRAGRLEFGVLSASTGAATGSPGERFEVARGRLALAGRSYLGGFWSRRAGVGEERSTAGVDVGHFFPGEVRLQGFAARDAVGGSEAGAWFAALERGGDRAAFTLSALELEPGFAPAVGLVARPGTLRLEASGVLPWFPGEAAGVRRYAPSLSWIRYADRRGDGLDERAAAGFEIGWTSDRLLRFEVARQRELLPRPFALYRGVVVPAGSYARWEAALSAASNPARALAGAAELRAGGLYGGEHVFASASLSWRPSRFLVLAPAALADRVELPQASFTAWVARARAGVTFSPRLRLDLLGQYESERRALGGGLRARYDLREGTEILFAWDSVDTRGADAALRAPGEPRRAERGALKFSYLRRL
jgi:hypothetical protein